MQAGKERDLFDKGTLLVPLRATELARSLASAYVVSNTPVGHDGDDKTHEGVTIGFRTHLPRWADRSSEGDPLVVLKVEATGEEVETNVPGCVRFKSPLRITGVSCASFETKDLMQDFVATYLSFPDIPENLVKLEVSEIPRLEKDAAGESVLELGTPSLEALSRDTMDGLAGWCRVLVENMNKGEFDQEISGIVSRGCKGPEVTWSWKRLAENALEELDSDAKQADKVIWGELVSLLLKHRSERGFDRRAVLQQLEMELSREGEIDENTSRWISVSRDIAAARRDMAPLSDEGSVGQRAALAIFVAQDPRGIDGLGAGRRVAFLAKLFAGAFQGISRAAGELKNDPAQLDAALEIAERIPAGQTSELEIGSRSYDSDLRSSDDIILNGSVIGRRVSEPTPYRIMLRARAMETNQKILPERETGRLRIVSRDGDKVKIYLEDEPGSILSNPLVRFWTPLQKVTARSPSAKKLKEILAESWRTGCAVGIYEVDGTQMLCCYVVILTNTLDREEFEHHVASLRSFAEAF
ncbi:hypothetical protein GCM10011517_26490 [Actibacterium pelagium]|uniref:Uncharacterized protein n=2 Tax=Actibacterium pelagium TaxID=2029103 RepID=A0A917AJG3_9RHOB|nr:hypothetical protein GCM10011517_26490 [Actibacterium pelagium]